MLDFQDPSLRFASSARSSVDADPDRASHGITNGTEARPSSVSKFVDPAIDLARCFLRLANLPSYRLDRLSRYEATLWRQASQIPFALDALDRRKPQDRGRRFRTVAGNTCRPTSAMRVDFQVRRSGHLLDETGG